jgi:hypothetical protein
VLTGAFRDSIDGQASSEGMTLFATVDYAEDVEFGNSHRRAQPTLMPAIMTTQDELGKIIARDIERLK